MGTPAIAAANELCKGNLPEGSMMGEIAYAVRGKPRAKAGTVKPKEADSVRRKQKSQSSRSRNSAAEQVLNLHGTIGNQAVQRLAESGTLQTKLRVNQPGDIYEQEADRLAEQVTQRAAPPVQRQPNEDEEKKDELAQTEPLGAEIAPLGQRQSEEEKDVLPRRSYG